MTELATNGGPDDEAPRLQFALAVVFLVITAGAALDLFLDRPRTLWSAHVMFELTLLVMSLGVAGYLGWGWYGALAEVRALRTAP